MNKNPDSPATNNPNRRFVFVCGLHRSGTSFITRYIAEHEEVSGFSNTGFPEDEGQYLQTVFPIDHAYGGPGRFGFDPLSHMTETSPYARPEYTSLLHEQWSKYWDESCPVLIEKSPSNLLRMRLLQSMFRNAYFIVITRHPIAASLATQKWSHTSLFSLVSHWVHSYKLAHSDSAHIRRVVWLSYESFIANPQAELDRIFNFIGISRLKKSMRLKSQNSDYFEAWKKNYCFVNGQEIKREEQVGYHRRKTGSLSRRVHAKCTLWKNKYKRLCEASDLEALYETDLNAFSYSFRNLELYPDFAETNQRQAKGISQRQLPQEMIA